MNSSELSSALRMAVAHLHKNLRKQMYSVDAFSMTEIDTIGQLSKNPSLLPTELAALAKVKTQSMSQILNRLEEQGIVKRTPSKDDKRKVAVSLTAFGKKLIEKTRYDRDEWLKGKIESSLTEKEKELLVKALPVLVKISETK